MEPIIVIGAGPSGLSAAYHLEHPCLLLEAADRIGGLCRSVVDGDFTFDQAGHIMFTTDPYIKDVLYPKLLGDNLHWQAREAWIYNQTTEGGIYTRYPFQAAFFGLPVAAVTECLLGAIEAIHGNGQAEAPRNFEEFIYRHWGTGIAKHFMIPYNQKLWAVPLAEMAYDWLGPRVPQPKLEDMIIGALQPQPKPMGPNAYFGYPLRGGFEALMQGFVPLLAERAVEQRCNSRVTAVSPRRHTVTINGQDEVAYDRLLSSMPLPELIRAIGGEAPASIRAAADQLRHVSIRCVNVGVAGEKLTDKHWIYYAGDTVFHRIFVQSNASPYCQPPGTTSYTAEISYSRSKPLTEAGLNERVIADLQRVGLLPDRRDVLVVNQVDIPYAYVVQDHVRRGAVATIRSWLAEHDIFLCGRYAEWEYYNSDNALASGKRAAEQLNALAATRPPTLSSARPPAATKRDRVVAPSVRPQPTEVPLTLLADTRAAAADDSAQ